MNCFRRRALVAVCIALVIGGFATTPAIAGSDTIDVANTGQILAGGAAVTTEVTVTCTPQFPGDEVTVRLILTQAVKRDQITSADSGFIFGVPCDDEPHVLSLTLVPSPFAFQKGSAFAQVTAGGMVPRFSTDEVIDLVK